MKHNFIVADEFPHIQKEKKDKVQYRNIINQGGK